MEAKKANVLKFTLFRYECCGQNTPGICRHLKSNWKYMLCSLFYALKSKRLPCEIYTETCCLNEKLESFSPFCCLNLSIYGLLTIKTKVVWGGREKLITKNKGYKDRALARESSSSLQFTKRRPVLF